MVKSKFSQTMGLLDCRDSMQDFFPQCSFKTWTNDCSANLFSKHYQAVLDHCNFTQATPVLFQRSHFGEILVTDPKVTVKTTDLSTNTHVLPIEVPSLIVSNQPIVLQAGSEEYKIVPKQTAFVTTIFHSEIPKHFISELKGKFPNWGIFATFLYTNYLPFSNFWY